MSGHANFHTIGGLTALHLPPSPQVEDDIHVAGNQPVGGANDGGIGVGPQDGPQNARVDAQAESTKALVRQLRTSAIPRRCGRCPLLSNTCPTGTSPGTSSAPSPSPAGSTRKSPSRKPLKGEASTVSSLA